MPLLQVIAVPEIRHVTVPTTGGRIIICSDGVWDHMQPKGMIHQVSCSHAVCLLRKFTMVMYAGG
jgi:serine/threonine protein phosphatase PrpC